MFFSSAWEKSCFWACRINSTIQLETCLVSSYFCLLIPMELSECDRASSRSTGQFPSWKFATKARNLSPCTLPLTSTVIVVAFDENPTTVIFSYTQILFLADIFLLLLSADPGGIDAGESEYDKVWSRSNGQISSWGFATKVLNMSPCTVIYWILPLTSTVVVIAFNGKLTTVIFLLDWTVSLHLYESSTARFDFLHHYFPSLFTG